MNKWLLVFMGAVVGIPASLAVWTATAAISDTISPILVPRGAQVAPWAQHCVGCHTKVECDLEFVEALENDMKLCRMYYEEKVCVAVKNQIIQEAKSCVSRNST